MTGAAAAALLRHPLYPNGLSREGALEWYRADRAKTREIFAIPTADMYYKRPIDVRNPIVFYEGHLPAFAVNTLVKLTFGKRGVDEHLEEVFARGIDPDSAVDVDESSLWPDRETVKSYVAAAEALIEKTLREEPLLEEPVVAILEHEQMHQETFLYMLHNLPYDKKVKPVPSPAAAGEGGAKRRLRAERVRVPAGVAVLGNATSFGWDNEFPVTRVDVDAFEIESHSVTNGAYLEYMRETRAPAPHFWVRKDDQWFWRGMFELIPLPLDWPVYATYDEAAAYAKWNGGRVPTEGEYDRALIGTPTNEGNFDFRSFDPVPAGAYPNAVSKWGVYDLIGNGWEWTSTIFDGFPGFEPMRSYPNYSADFFDGKHYVLKGASPATARELVRPSFRNWFRGNYPYVYAKFRCAW